jgi:hypothetical protein
MEQDFDIKADIAKILALCHKANPYGTTAQKEADAAFWLAVKTLDRRGKDGIPPVNPGRFVRLPAKDSYAYYVVTRVTKKSIKLTHIPYGCRYESNAVRDGEADVDIIERAITFQNKIDTQFERMGRAPLPERMAEYGFRDQAVEDEITRMIRLGGLTREQALQAMMLAQGYIERHR